MADGSPRGGFLAPDDPRRPYLTRLECDAMLRKFPMIVRDDSGVPSISMWNWAA